MKSFILRLLTAFVCYQVGESLAGCVVPDDMGPPSISGVIDYTFNYRHYDLNRIGYMAFMSSLLILADWIGPKRIHIAWLALFAVFCGVYNYVMSARNYLAEFDNNMVLYPQTVMPEIIAYILGSVAVFLVWFFPVILLAVIKLAFPSSGHSAIGGSKS